MPCMASATVGIQQQRHCDDRLFTATLDQWCEQHVSQCSWVRPSHADLLGLLPLFRIAIGDTIVLSHVAGIVDDDVHVADVVFNLLGGSLVIVGDVSDNSKHLQRGPGAAWQGTVL